MALVVKGGGSLAAFDPSTRGPNGRRKPPHTPDYSKAATAQVATWAELQTAISNAVAGDVIEVTADLTSDLDTVDVWPSQTGTDTPTSLSWATNVLVRPPLGERRALSRFRIYCQNITFAGFDLTDAARIENFGQTGTPLRQYGKGSYLWRCVVLSTAGYLRMGADDCGMVEVVAAKRDLSGVGSDRSNFSSGPDDYDCRILVDGCYLSGIWRVPDVATTLIPRTSVTSTGAGQVLASATVGVGGYTVTGFSVNIPAYPLTTSTSQATVSLRADGTAFATYSVPSTVTLPFTWTIRENSRHGLNQALAEGAALTVTLDAVPADLVGLAFEVTVGKQSNNHSDTLQCVRTNGNSGGYVHVSVLNSIIEPADNASGQMVAGTGGNQYAGDLLIMNNLFPAGGENGLTVCQTVTGDDVNKAGYEHLVGNDFGELSAVDYAPRTLTSNRIGSYKINNVVTTSGGEDNLFTADAGGNPAYSRTLPPLPDLAAIWPECPFTGSAR